MRQATGDHSQHYGQGTVGGDGSLVAQGRVEAPVWSSCLRVNPQAGPGSWTPCLPAPGSCAAESFLDGVG